MSYEKLENQGMGSREALKFMSKSVLDNLGPRKVENYPMDTRTPSTDSSAQEGAKIKAAADRAGDLTQQDLLGKLRSAQINAVQGSIGKEFNGLGDSATNQLYAKAGVGIAANLIGALSGKTPAQQATAKAAEVAKAAKKKQMPIALIAGGLSLVVLVYVLFLR